MAQGQTARSGHGQNERRGQNWHGAVSAEKRSTGSMDQRWFEVQRETPRKNAAGLEIATVWIGERTTRKRWRRDGQRKRHGSMAGHGREDWVDAVRIELQFWRHEQRWV
ncbi:hypothetical protein M0R45_002332 [Rubus argutus]|uniref:Uncharacterized protein n=1 Tax=Rubus argutus TaxID=59490 RepID=A0AAW1VJQ2_RUBAR